jgi:hypothetical protein
LSLAGHGPGAPLCLPVVHVRRRLDSPTWHRCPARGAGGGSGRLPRVGSARPDRTGPRRRSRGAGRGAQRGARRVGEEAPTGLRPQENKQVFSGYPEPRPSPLPSASPLPLPSPGVGRCAWHIPHILPPVSSARPPLPGPSSRGAAGEIKARAPLAEPGASFRRLCRVENFQANSSGLAIPEPGALHHVKGPRCLVAPLLASDEIWPRLGANDFHRCCRVNSVENYCA